MGLVEAGLLFCAVVWGSTFCLTKGVLGGVDAVVMVGYRFLLAALLLWPAVRRKKGRFKLLKESAALAALLVTLYVAQTVGLKYTSASNSGFITGLFVIFVPLFMLVFFGKPPSLAQWGVSALALGGLWLLTGGVSSFGRGDAMTLLAAASYAAHLLVTDKYVKAEADTALLAFHQFWMTGLLSLGLAAAAGSPWRVRTPAAAGVIVFLAVLPTIVCFFIQMGAQRSASPLKVSLFFSLEPVFAAAFAWTAGGERFLPARAAGGGVIVLAMILGELSKLALPRARRKEVLPI